MNIYNGFCIFNSHKNILYMKLSWLSAALLFGILSAGVVGCDDEDDDDRKVTPATGAGKGGTVGLWVVPVHDSIDVDSGMVYIKYNALVMAADSSFDDSAKCEKINNRPTAAFYSLRKGDYYFFCKGWDRIRSKPVKGSRTYKVEVDYSTTFTLDLQTKETN
jgi:hypothetical protein